LNNTQIPQVNDVTYLGVHIDRRLTWRRHIERKKVQLKLKASNFNLRLDYKVLLYNSTLKPIWAYGSQTLESMMVTMQQSMMEFMSFMKTTMQTLVQSQNMVLQLLAAKQS